MTKLPVTAERRERGRRLSLVTVIVGLIMLALLAFLQSRPKLVDQALEPEPLGFGNPSSPVQIVAFLSPTCPHCAKFELTVGKDLYVRAEAEGFYYAVYPLVLEEDREVYTQALFCAFDGGGLPHFLTLHYQNYYLQQGRGLRELARRAGMNPETFSRCLKAPKTEGRIQETLAWARHLGVEGTPAFFIKTDGQSKFEYIQGNRGEAFWNRVLATHSESLAQGKRMVLSSTDLKSKVGAKKEGALPLPFCQAVTAGVECDKASLRHSAR